MWKGFYRGVARSYLKKPDQAELLAIKFPSVESIARAAANEFAYQVRHPRSHRLTSVNLELTNKCNLRCSMCPVNQDMVRPKGFMDPALFLKILDENPQLEFILAFQWGEPLMHPQFFELVAEARQRGVRVMITTNGTYLNKTKRTQLLQSDLERITFSVDGVGDVHTRIRGYEYDRLKKDILAFKDERDRSGRRTPYIDVSMVVFEETESYVEAFKEEWTHLVDRVQTIPKFVSGPRVSPCRELWRGTSVVLWDGRVTICCRDSEGSSVVGDANRERLTDIWNGEKMQEIRRSHATKNFGGLCRTCSEFESSTVSPRFS